MKRLTLFLVLVLTVGLIYVGNVYSGSDEEMASVVDGLVEIVG